MALRPGSGPVDDEVLFNSTQKCFIDLKGNLNIVVSQFIFKLDVVCCMQ